MKKLIPLAALALLALHAAPSARAQYSARTALSNFDLVDGVRVPEPAPQPTTAPSRKVRMTALHRAELERSRAALKATPNAPNATRAATATAPAGVSPYAPAVSPSLGGYTTGDASVDSLIAASGARHGVDPVLLYAIMHRESAFKKRALSHKGARGLMQLMPATAARFGVRDIFDPQQNIDAGARYMRWLLNRFDGDVRLALAGYNAGEGAVDKYGRRVPPYRETQEYVRRISERYSLMRDPEAARRAPVVNRAQAVVAANQTAQPPSALYEPNVYSVRLPDGKLMLVSQ
ncbi:MAG TPA: lytic transglycosylase domain-containing protein [Pyrinomonadaceae bacterium]|nr:lytic transglycosylase domain-containing protein [Pyrinomonadaceae bacterium]